MKHDLISQKYLSCDVGDRLIAVIGQMATHQTHTVLIFDGKTFVGMLDPHTVLRQHTSKETKVKGALHHVKRLSPDATESQIARDLLDNNVHALPVLKNGKVLGVVNAIDIASSLLGSGGRTLIQRFASARPVYFFETTPIAKALPMLRIHHLDHAPIVDEHMNVTGIVSISDILMRYVKLPLERQGSRRVKRASANVNSRVSAGALGIGALATSLVITAKPTDTVRSAVDLMYENGISSVVLTESEHLVGIITLTDVLRVLIS